MTPEQRDEHERFRQLEAHVDHGEQKERADHLWGEGYLQYSGAQLDVLTACFHSNGPPLPDGGGGSGFRLTHKIHKKKSHDSLFFDRA